MIDFSKLENFNGIIIDEKLKSTINTYKQDDNILYSFGINNIILGVIKISSESLKNKKENKENEKFDYKLFKNLIPIGMYINGVIVIYKENTYEDIKIILKEQCEKITEFQSEKKVNYIQLALKEMLDLDDNDKMNFEFKKYNEMTDELEILFIDNPIEKSSMYYYFVNRIYIYFNNDKIKNKIDIEITEDIINKFKLNKDIICKISDKKNNQEFIIDNVNSLTPEKSEHITKFIDTLNKFPTNDLNIKSIFIQIGKKDLFFSNINIKNILIKLEENESYNLYLETIGIISKKENNYNLIITEIYNKTIQNIINFLSSIQSNEITQNLLLYNKLYSTFPLQITQKTKITKEKSIITISKNSKIQNQNYLIKVLNIKGLRIYNLNPIITNQIELWQSQNVTYIKSPHLFLKKKLTSNEKIISYIKGDYLYYHYNKENINDIGWGCAYRSLQTLFSWFTLNTSIGKRKKIPSILEIQITLFKLGDKDKNFINSNSRIGSYEVCLVLNELLGIESKIIFVPSGKDISNKGKELIFHFQNNGTPIMIGGDVYAYTILGIDYDFVKDECMFLILDPHYSGDDNINDIINNGWCCWKGIELFKQNSFYNMCLPLIN